jgi:sirohydrochlorin ferrochelatase
MNALLLLAHGSPRASANAALERLVDRLSTRPDFAMVRVGYLECNVPSIPEAIDACVEAGATDLVVVPWFLHVGTHVAQDLPAFLREGRERHPNVRFRLSDYVGLSPQVTGILADRAVAILQANE